MTMQGTDWGESLSRPSRVLSNLAMVLGAWVLLLTIVNITIGAYSPGFKVMWIGFISGDSAASNVPHEGSGVVMDDMVFALLGVVLLVLGSMGMKKLFDGGVMEWFGGLSSGPVASSLLSSENGIRRTMASWMVEFHEHHMGRPWSLCCDGDSGEFWSRHPHSRRRWLIIH